MLVAFCLQPFSTLTVCEHNNVARVKRAERRRAELGGWLAQGEGTLAVACGAMRQQLAGGERHLGGALQLTAKVIYLSHVCQLHAIWCFLVWYDS